MLQYLGLRSKSTADDEASVSSTDTFTKGSDLKYIECQKVNIQDNVKDMYVITACKEGH